MGYFDHTVLEVNVLHWRVTSHILRLLLSCQPLLLPTTHTSSTMATEGKKDDDYDAELGGRFDTLMVRCLPRHASAAPA